MASACVCSKILVEYTLNIEFVNTFAFSLQEFYMILESLNYPSYYSPENNNWRGSLRRSRRSAQLF